MEPANEKSAPNILFICVDDLRPDLGCYGNSVIKTPNIDKLANSSYLFANHFVQVPTCGASRASMLTGMLPSSKEHLSNHVIRNYISNQPESDRPETFIHHLKRNGYYTVGIGKISHYPDGLLYGMDESVSNVRELPYSWDELSFDSGIWGTGWNAFFGYADGSNRTTEKNRVKPYEKANVEDNGYPDGLISTLAIKKLQELAIEKRQFFLGVGFFKPHLPFTAPATYWDLYDEKEIPLSPNSFAPVNVNRESLHDSNELNRYLLTDEKVSIDSPASEDYARKLRHAYFASISYIDAQIGKIVDELHKLNLQQNTIIIIWGDHGWHLGDHLIWGKHTIFERSLKSAFIIKLNGGGTSQKIIMEQIVSSIDIYPTVMALCGLDMPHETDGRSLLPIMNDKNSNVWENVSYGYFRNGISMRTARYRLTKYFRDNEPIVELYDHMEDPNEVRNIAAGNQDIVNSLMSLWEKGNNNLFD
ncbi:MAG: sulfatase [Cyclobacteriaceae bacterium]|nr:sulfatase [Cyclobacteriaceae bacterium]